MGVKLKKVSLKGLHNNKSPKLSKKKGHSKRRVAIERHLKLFMMVNSIFKGKH